MAEDNKWELPEEQIAELGNSSIKLIKSHLDILSHLAISSEQFAFLEENLGKLKSIIEKARSSNIKNIEQSAFTYDKIETHFTSITVNSYRGLKDIKIQKLSKINLFAGINNSGKTSLLEAVYLLCKQNDFSGLVDIIRRRGKFPEGQMPQQWLSNQLSQTAEINGIFNNRKCETVIQSFIEKDISLDRSIYLKTVEITVPSDDDRLESLTQINQGIGNKTQSDSIKLLCKTAFSSPFFLNEPANCTEFYYKSVQSKLLPRILNFIREKIVPTISDIRLVDEFQRFLVIDDKFEKAMDLTSYGEGLQKIFFASLLFASAENGVVLIDEFENAIHIELLETFSSFIHLLAKEFNVQVFLTSHSKECIDAFIKSVPEGEINDFAFHALARSDDDKIIVREFDGEKFFKLLDAGDVDLRKAR